MSEDPPRPQISKTRLAIVRGASLAAALGALGAIFVTLTHRSGPPPREPDRGIPAKAFRKGRPLPPTGTSSAGGAASPAPHGGAWKGSRASGPPAWARPESATAVPQRP